jgi:hypothetical protein
MASKIFDPTLRDFAVRESGYRIVQELPQFRAEALVVQVNKDVSLRMSDIEGAHTGIIPRFPGERQEIKE